MNRLWVRLVLAFTLVVLLVVGAVALLIIRTTNTQFRRYITDSGMQGSGSGLQQLVSHYEQQGSWEGVDSLLAQGIYLDQRQPMPDPNWRPDRRGGPLEAILADANGQIVYDTAGEEIGKKLKPREKSRALPITQDDGQVIGYLVLSLGEEPGPLGGLEQRFLDQMQRILTTGAVLAVVAGLAFGVLFSRSLTAPLQRLSAAARAVATGDLEQRVQAEGSAEMVEVAQAFNEMTTALAESERNRQNMVADVAHELRTPLTVLQGNLRAILDDVYPMDREEISRLYDETRLLSRLVDDLRELALADAGQLGLHPHPTDVGRVIQNTIDSLSVAAEAQEVTLSGQFADDLPAVQADSDRVAQVLRNLLINALRHTPPGGSVNVQAAPAGNAVEIAVVDTGEGIAAEHLPHVFERFWRVDPSRSRAGGCGLGLSVAQSLVEAHGGRIWAESTPGQGSTFRFTLPAAQLALEGS